MTYEEARAALTERVREYVKAHATIKAGWRKVKGDKKGNDQMTWMRNWVEPFLQPHMKALLPVIDELNVAIEGTTARLDTRDIADNLLDILA